MAKDRERRRRGHRRGRRGREQPPSPPSEERQDEAPDASDEGEAPADSPSRFSFWRRRQGEVDKTEEKGKEPVRRARSAERTAAGSAPSASPLSFWRRGQARPYRVQRQPKNRSLSRRISGIYLPPWVPVVAIIAVVFGILGLFFFTQSATGAPSTTDHWHARYEIIVCGVRQPNVPFFSGSVGIHTHGGGLIHMHPSTPAGEGSGARLVKWFDYGGGKLTQDEMRIAGQSQTYRNGDLCDDGSEGVLQVFVDDADSPEMFERLDNWSRYIPQDGDVIRIVFGPEEGSQVSTDEGIVIPPEEATREISIEASDQGNPSADSFFAPNTFTIDSGEIVKVNVTNTGTVTHNLRVEGVDKEYDTEDDFATKPLIILPDEEGFTVVRIEEPGQYAFRCDIHPNIQFGTLIVVGDGSSPSPPPTATPEATAASP